MNYETTVQTEDSESYAVVEDGGDGVVVVESGSGSRRRWYAVAAVVAAILIVGGMLLMRGGDEAALAPADGSQVPVVTVVSPGRTTVEGTINATGSLAARRAMPVGSVGEGGRVVSVPVDAGDWVRQGQVLASIDRSVQVQQAEGARAQIGVAQADLQLAQSNLDRALKLVDRGFISKADVDRLTANRDAARARVGVARAQLGELQARTARLNIYAPASGLVLERNVEPGQTVGGGGTPLFVIARGGEMELMARLGEEDLARISAGASATVTPVGSDKTFTGQVWQIAPTVDAQSRQGTARIALAYAPELRPGGFASAELASGTVVAPMLPESAIMSDDKGSYVYAVGKDDKIVRRPVETGMVTAKGILIRSGLTGSEKVVLRAGGFLNPGETVKPVRAGG